MSTSSAIDVRVERGPAQLDVHPPRVSALGSPLDPGSTGGSLERGHVRLVVEMPAGFPRSALLAFALLFAGLVMAGLISWMLLAIAAVTATAFLVLVAIVLGWFSRREVLEVDSRLITLKRGSALIFSTQRERVDAVWLAERPSVFAVPWGTARVLLGSAGVPAIAAGTHISETSALELVDVISGFLKEHPAHV